MIFTTRVILIPYFISRAAWLILDRAPTLNPSPPLVSIKGSGRGCPLLRASNEHSFTVRVLRARRAPGRSLPHPSQTACCASTEDHQAPSRPYCARSASKKDGLAAPYPSLEKYEWDVSYTLACRRLRQQRCLPSRVKAGSKREQDTRKRKPRTQSTT